MEIAVSIKHTPSADSCLVDFVVTRHSSISFARQDWLESQGIFVNGPEHCPDDPYIRNRTDREAIHMARTPSDFDALRQFLEMDRRVLRYYAVWDDRDQMYGDMRKFIIHVSTMPCQRT